MSTPQYSITIGMSVATVTGLMQSGYSLCAFKAVQSANRAALPVVWSMSQNLANTVVLAWTGQYQAYISTTQTGANDTIVAMSLIDIELGQTANVDKNGVLTVTNQGTERAISIDNGSSQQWTAGIAQPCGGGPSPFVALPLYGNFLEVMAPVEKILLMFIAGSVSVGTIIRSSRSRGLLVDFTGATSRNLTFDINKGWDWGGASWGTAVSPQTDLSSILITRGPLAKSQLKRKAEG
jgi:hypothetical protein